MKFVKSRYTLVAVALAIFVTTSLAIYSLVLVKRIHTERAKTSYKKELSVIHQQLSSYGFTFSAPEQSCDKLYLDQSVYLNCRYRQFGEIQVDDDFIKKWQSRAPELMLLLDSSGWKKLPNLDAVTDNPVDSLPRLLEHMGMYPADVLYEKESGSVVCDFYLYVVPADQATLTPILNITERCQSIANNWL